MSQTIALFVDSYRELNAKKLFWITIGLSGIVVLIFLGVGFNQIGISTFGRQWQTNINTTVVTRAYFYRSMFFQLGVNFWLTWAATILALVSTSGIFPDLVSGGSIDLYLSKPISRLRLFLTKYLTGLLFVALQVGVFTAASILVLRVRGGAWFPGIFLAVPAVLLFYSYIYCVCVLLGVITRSTVASLLLAILFWLMIFGVHYAETKVLTAKLKDEIVAARLDRLVIQDEKRIKDDEAKGAAPPSYVVQQLRGLRVNQRDNRDDLESSAKWHHRIYVAKSWFPKTSETVALMDRWLIAASEFKDAAGDFADPDAGDEPTPLFFGITTDDMRAEFQTRKAIRARPVGWVVGTSLAFEAVVLAASAWLFCRRDY